MEKFAFEVMDESCVQKYTFTDNTADRDVFLDFCLQTILYQYQSALAEG
jgi:hypothetical protein